MPITTGFKIGSSASTAYDISGNFVSKDYLMEVYPYLSSNLTRPSLWVYNTSYGLSDKGIANGGLASPKIVQTGAGWNKVSTGQYHGMALKTDGSLWVWGNGGSGQLGQGNTSNATNLIQISGTWTDICASDYGCHAIKNDGTLWYWGSGSENYLDSAIQRLSPTQVNAGPWKRLFPNQSSTMFYAQKTDGTVWFWGYATSGLAGGGHTPSTYNFYSPTRLLNDSNFKWMNAKNSNGGGFIKTDGTLWTFGDGINPSSSFTSTPLQDGTDTDWADFLNIGFQSGRANLAIKQDGSLYFRRANSGITSFTLMYPEKTFKRLYQNGETESAYVMKKDGSVWKIPGLINAYTGEFLGVQPLVNVTPGVRAIGPDGHSARAYRVSAIISDIGGL